jgi:cation transport ATPase
VALNSLPNVVQAAKDLQRGEIGLAAQYTVGLGFMLRSGRPFNSSAIGTLMQAWPQLARRKYVRSRRRLIAAEHRRATWANIAASDGAEVEVPVDELRGGERIVVRRGETVPASGVVERGSATVVNGTLLGRAPVEELSKGDPIAAGAFVRDGEITIHSNEQALSLRDLSSHLPQSVLPTLPSFQEAERIANRNAKPALALSAAALAATRTLRPAQAVLRPDYVTAPRLSAELSTLHATSDALQRGVLFKTPAALDRLSRRAVYVFDDSAGALPAEIVAKIKAVDRKAQIVYLSQRTAAEGVDAVHVGLTPAAKVELIRSLGSKTVWIGDGSDPSHVQAIAACTVSISVAPLSAAQPDRADILIPQRGVTAVPEALEVARAHRRRIARDYRIVYFVNTLGVAGGLFGRATSLHTGLLSNAGTALVYAQHARALDRLIRMREAQRARLRSAKRD